MDNTGAKFKNPRWHLVKCLLQVQSIYFKKFLDPSHGIDAINNKGKKGCSSNWDMGEVTLHILTNYQDPMRSKWVCLVPRKEKKKSFLPGKEKLVSWDDDEEECASSSWPQAWWKAFQRSLIWTSLGTVGDTEGAGHGLSSSFTLYWVGRALPTEDHGQFSRLMSRAVSQLWKHFNVFLWNCIRVRRGRAFLLGRHPMNYFLKEHMDAWMNQWLNE